MSCSPMQVMAGQQQLQLSEPTPVQARLQSLVQQLDWSYAALWLFNRQTSKLGWKEGHWRQSDTRGWNHEHYFSCAFKSCQFRTGCGAVGMAYEKCGNLWMHVPSFLDREGSKERSEFLQNARISTVIFISWPDGVLELGTCVDVPENLELMKTIRSYIMTLVLPALGPEQGSDRSQTGGVVPQAPPPGLPEYSRGMRQPSSYASLSPLRRHLSDSLSARSFEPNSMNHRRLASMPDMFLAVDAEGKEALMNTDNLFLMDASASASAGWGMPTVTPRAGALQTQQPPASQMYYPPIQPQRNQPQGQTTYRSCSGTTSPSVSSLEEVASTLLSGDSPEQNVLFMASSQRQPSHSNTSSSPRRGTSSHSPELQQLEDPLGCQSLQDPHASRVDDDLTLDQFLMLEGSPLEAPGTYSFPPLETSGTMSAMTPLLTNGNPSLESRSPNHHHDHANAFPQGASSYAAAALPQHGQPGQACNWSGPPVARQGRPFKTWRRTTRSLAPPLRKKRQDLLRRCLDMVKQIPRSIPPTGPEKEAHDGMMMPQRQRHGASSSSPETVIDGIPNESCFNQDPPRVQRRPRQGPRTSSMGAAVHQGHEEAAKNHMMAERRRRVKQKENFAALRTLVPIISKADKASILGDAIVYLKDLQSQIEGLGESMAESERRFERLQNSYNELEQRNKEMESMVHLTRLHSM